MIRDKEIRILCYGDSNTWGYIPGSNHGRYLKTERWTGILQDSLGSDFIIIEEGLNSRTLVSNDTRPGKEGKNGAEYLTPCLDTCDPVDICCLMLGTNELKAVYNKTAEEIGKLVEDYFIKIILNRKSQFMNSTPSLILICPPLVDEYTDYANEKYHGAHKKSLELNAIYKNLAEKYNCGFVANDKLSLGIDGVHMDKNGHKKLAEMLECEIRTRNKKK